MGYSDRSIVLGNFNFPDIDWCALSGASQTLVTLDSPDIIYDLSVDSDSNIISSDHFVISSL